MILIPTKIHHYRKNHYCPVKTNSYFIGTFSNNTKPDIFLASARIRKEQFDVPKLSVEFCDRQDFVSQMTDKEAVAFVRNLLNLDYPNEPIPYMFRLDYFTNYQSFYFL